MVVVVITAPDAGGDGGGIVFFAQGAGTDAGRGYVTGERAARKEEMIRLINSLFSIL